MSARRHGGKGSGRRKFTREQVLAIRDECEEINHHHDRGFWLDDFAEMLGVGEQCLYQIYSGMTYAWVIAKPEFVDTGIIRSDVKRYTSWKAGRAAV